MQMSLNPLEQMDPVVIGATVVIFGATYVTLRKVFVLPYLQVMEKRQELFEQSDKQYEERDQALSSGDADAKTKVAEAREAAEQLVSEATEQAEVYRRERLESATRTASERLEQGRARIAAAKEAELSQLRQEAVECVGMACDRLLGETDGASVEAVVDRLMSRRVQ